VLVLVCRWLHQKSLTAGSNVILTDNGGEVLIAANVGQGYEDRVGINLANYAVTGTTSYVGVRNTIAPVVISLAGIATIPANSGRKVTVMDESGGAGITPILVVPGVGSLINAAGSHSINTPYGSATFVFDGNDWYITASRP
jgi:hypothetical protein